MGTLWQDARFGLRMMIAKPGFTIIAALALSLGIGANTAIFSVVNTVLLRPLAYKDPGRIVLVWWTAPKLTENNLPASAPDFTDWKTQSRTFERMAAIGDSSFNLTGEGEPERVVSAAVSADLFPLLGVNASRGRTFTAEEEQVGKDKVVVISHDLWQRRFGANPNLVGRQISLDNESYTVVGIMPRGFNFPEGTEKIELYVPLALTPEVAEKRGHRFLYVVARLKDGVSFDQAQTEMTALSQRMTEAHPDTNTDWTVKLQTLPDAMTEDVSTALFVLLGAVGFVLLIACANVANLQLARAAARQREVAIRLALGASRWRLVRQFLMESTLLALLGGALGLLIAFWGIDAILAVLPEDVPHIEQIGIDTPVFIFTLLVSLGTGLVLGLVPALQATKPDLIEALKDGGKAMTSGTRRNRVRSLLVVAEVALALVLLIGAGLMMKSFWHLRDVNPGFDPQNVLTMQIALPENKYEEAAKQINFFEELLGRLHALPGVASAEVVRNLPLADDSRSDFSVEGQGDPPQGEERMASYGSISPGYFGAMRIPLIKGRAFTEADRDGAEPVAIINSSFARRYFAGEEAVGQRIKQGGAEDEGTWMKIVGVVTDIRRSGLDVEPSPEVYSSYLQEPDASMVLVVRSASGNPETLLPSIRSEVRAVDNDQPVFAVETMEHRLTQSVASRRLSVMLLGIFAALAFVLASVGIYGVVSYSVTQRTHEMGVRIALGASRRDILRLIVGQGMLMVAIGLALGLAAAFLLTRVMESLLFGVSATDPLTFTLVALFLAVVAFIASFIPARRATRVDPMVALRYE